jgi:hypothetical protein
MAKVKKKRREKPDVFVRSRDCGEHLHVEMMIRHPPPDVLYESKDKPSVGWSPAYGAGWDRTFAKA